MSFCILHGQKLKKVKTVIAENSKVFNTVPYKVSTWQGLTHPQNFLLF